MNNTDKPGHFIKRHNNKLTLNWGLIGALAFCLAFWASAIHCWLF